jgi:hypothetical protein
VSLDKTGDKLEFGPRFLCPVCEGRPVFQPKTSFTVGSKLFNFNQQVAFMMPCCGTPVVLYVAVHKAKDAETASLCISVAPIRPDWWETQP